MKWHSVQELPVNAKRVAITAQQIWSKIKPK